MALSSPLKVQKSSEYKSRISEKEYGNHRVNPYNDGMKKAKMGNERFFEKDKKK